MIMSSLQAILTSVSLIVKWIQIDFIDTFSLTNIVNSKTCFKILNETLLDIMLTKNLLYKKSFCKTCTVETGLTDCHKMIVTILRAYFKIILSKNIVYRDYKHFHENEFLHELDLEKNKDKFYSSYNPYDDFSNLFKTIIDKHSPIKQKKVRGNNFLFMTKELRKAIMDRSRLRNKYLKYPSGEDFVNMKKTNNNPSTENFVNMKKMKNKYISICRKSKIKYLKRSTEKRISSSKQFWNFVQPFLTNKGC